MKRRKAISRLSLAGLALAIPSAIFSIHKADRYMQILTSTTKNPALSSVPGTENYKGAPLDQNGNFMNEEFPFWPNTRDVIKWKLIDSNPYKEEKAKLTDRLQVITHPSMDLVSDNTIVWLGHASFLIHISGIRILIDPVLGEPGFFLRRFSALPFAETEFKNIDYILVSHNHRDHCDKESIKLLAKLNPDATWLCGLGLDQLLLNEWTGSKNIQAAGWYQQYQLKNNALKISFLPTRHWSRRGLSDTNKSLWGAFMIENQDKKIYFGGDSGYGSHFRRVPELFEGVDYYLAGIGAFAPRWFMAPSHMHPEEAAQACVEILPKKILPMHFGTFDLSDEPLLEPIHLMEELKRKNAFKCELVLPVVGEILKCRSNRSCNIFERKKSPDSAFASGLLNFARYEFDLSELYARKFRKKLYDEKGAFSELSFFEPIYEDIQNEFSLRHSAAGKETDLGQNSGKLIALHEEVKKE